MRGTWVVLAVLAGCGDGADAPVARGAHEERLAADPFIEGNSNL